jgi:MFS family permease
MTTLAPAPGSGEKSAPRTRRDQTFHWLLSASSVSMLGSHMTAIAYPMVVLLLTDSPLVAGWAAFAAIAPSILVYMPAGALIDRWDPGRVMLISELGRGGAIAIVACAIALRKPYLTPLIVTAIIIAAIIEGILEVASTLAQRRYVGALVERKQIPSALARLEGGTHAVLVAGRPLGGLLFGIEPIFPFLADVCTFIYSAGVLIGIRKNRRAVEKAGIGSSLLPRPRLRSDIRRGLGWLRRDQFAWMTMVAFSTGTLIFQALIMVFLADARAQRLPALGIGMVLAASGVGGIFGSAAASRLLKRVGYSWIKIQAVTWIVGFAALAASAGRHFFLMAVVMAILGLTGALGNIELNVYLMQNVRQGMLARVTSVNRLAVLSACAVGPALGGILVQALRVQNALIVLAVMTIPLVVLSLIRSATGVSRNQVATR